MDPAGALRGAGGRRGRRLRQRRRRLDQRRQRHEHGRRDARVRRAVGRHRHAVPAVRDRPAAESLRLRHRGDGRDRRAARPRGRVHRHRFGTIFRDTANGQFDTAAAASTITPARQKQVNFSDPYYEAQQALLVPEGSDIASVDDLSGLIVGAQDGTTGETYANDETDASEVRGFPEGPNAVTALVNGQVDAVIIDQPVAADAVEKQGGVEIAEEIPTDELYGFAVAPDNTSLLDGGERGAADDQGRRHDRRALREVLLDASRPSRSSRARREAVAG